jgi:hypothetical protein
MLPHLTSQTLVLLKTGCNGVNSVLGEIGVIKCLEDYLKYTRTGNAVCAIAGEELVWKDPEFVEDFVDSHLFDKDGVPLLSTCGEEFHAALNDPTNAKIGYEMEIFDSVEGLFISNQSVLGDLAANYCIENWEVVRQLPGLMVLSVKGAKVK